MSNPDEAYRQGASAGSTTQGSDGNVQLRGPNGTGGLGGPRAQFRLGLVSFLAAAIGLAAGAIALVLYKLIGLFTNLFFYHRWDTAFVSARWNHLRWWVVVTPVIGGLVVGVMAKYGSAKIKGHGIPEAMEAVLFSRSRIQPRVAILKPLSAAIAIGTGGPFGAEGPIIQTGGAVGSLVGQVFHTTGSERNLLGGLCGLAAVGFSKLLYWVEDQFEKLPVDPLWWPAIGALGLGVIGYFVPRVLGVGYDTISDILNAQLALKLLLVVMIAKAVALVISLGSGTSGGLLAPMFMSSAALGGVFAMALNRIFPSANLAPGAFALVAMGAVFGAASRATFAFIIFAFEITRDYNAVLPLMLVSVIADGVAMLFMPTSSIMTEKLARRGLRIHQDYETDILRQVAIEETMDRDVPIIPAEMRVGELAERIAKHDPAVSHHQGLFIVDTDGKLAGLITRGDVLRALDQDPGGVSTVLEAGSHDLIVAFPDETISEASDRMLQNEIGRLPVVDRSDPRKLIGYLGRPRYHGPLASVACTKNMCASPAGFGGSSHCDWPRIQRVHTFAENHDPALETILSHRPPIDYDAKLVEAAKRNDLESVKTTIRAFQGDALVKYQFLEDSINTAGYDFMLRANFSAAVDLYKHGLDLNPDAWTLYESFGEVLQKAGDADGALKNYRASLTLNPRNFNAEDQIKVLEPAKVQPK